MKRISLSYDEKRKLVATGITIQSVNNWIAGRSFPNRHYLKVLSHITGRDYKKPKASKAA